MKQSLTYERMDVFLRLISYIRPYRGRVIIGISCTAATIGLDAVQPYVMGYVIDNILTVYVSEGVYVGDSFDPARVQRDLQFLMMLAGGLLMLNILNRFLLQKTGQDILYALRTEVYDHLQRLSLRFFNVRSTGELMSRATADVESLQNTVTDTIERVVVNVCTVIIIGVLLFTFSWKLALVTLTPLPIYCLMIATYNRRIRPLYAMARERVADISAILQDNLSDIRVIQCFARENHELARFSERCRALWTIGLRIIRTRAAFFPISRLVITLGPLMILLYGGSQVILGGVSASAPSSPSRTICGGSTGPSRV